MGAVADKFPWKVAWITGASGAICGEVARRLAAAGVKVGATARPSEKLDALVAASDNIKPFPALTSSIRDWYHRS